MTSRRVGDVAETSLSVIVVRPGQPIKETGYPLYDESG